MRVYTYPRLGLVGRLGNQLWEVAATLNFALRNPGSRASIPQQWEYAPYLSLPAGLYRPPEHGDEVIDVEHMPGGPYFQQLRYISAVRPVLRVYYSPSFLGLAGLVNRYLKIIDDMDQGRHFTALHVRRGDYLKHPGHFPQLTRRYWATATETVLAEEPGTTFAVFSDDIAWCRRNVEALGIADRAVIFVDGHVRPIPPEERTGEPADIYDLFLMARCARHVLSNSTFGWWSAFLSDDPAPIYPSVWFGPRVPNHERAWEAFPPEWRKVSC